MDVFASGEHLREASLNVLVQLASLGCAIDERLQGARLLTAILVLRTGFFCNRIMLAYYSMICWERTILECRDRGKELTLLLLLLLLSSNEALAILLLPGIELGSAIGPDTCQSWRLMGLGGGIGRETAGAGSGRVLGGQRASHTGTDTASEHGGDFGCVQLGD